MCVLTESAIVWISKCLNQQTSFQSQQMAWVAKISNRLSQQMSRTSQQMSDQQMSVSKCPVSKWKIGACPDTSLEMRERQLQRGCASAGSGDEVPTDKACSELQTQNIVFCTGLLVRKVIASNSFFPHAFSGEFETG